MRKRQRRLLFRSTFPHGTEAARLSQRLHRALRSTLLAGGTVLSATVFSATVFSATVFSATVFSATVFSATVFGTTVFGTTVFSTSAFAWSAPHTAVGQSPPAGVAANNGPAAPTPPNTPTTVISSTNTPPPTNTPTTPTPTGVVHASESAEGVLWTDFRGKASELAPLGQQGVVPASSFSPATGLVGEPLRESEPLPDLLVHQLPGRRLWHGTAESAKEDLPPNHFEFPLYGYQGAGHDQAIRWIIANGNGLGIFSFDMDNAHCPPNGDFFFSVHPDFTIHWVSGPRSTDLPPRMYDLLMRVQHSQALNDVWRYDVSATIGLYTDFEGSARRGLRWPTTAVLYCRPIPEIDFFAGVDILDRDDLFALPVAGVTWQPEPYWRFDFAFPKPRAAFRFDDGNWVYVSGDIGGGSWAIERQNGEDDVATYRDYRIQIGTLEAKNNGRKVNGCIGVAFDRHLQYRSQPGSFEPGATLYWQWESDF